MLQFHQDSFFLSNADTMSIMKQPFTNNNNNLTLLCAARSLFVTLWNWLPDHKINTFDDYFFSFYNNNFSLFCKHPSTTFSIYGAKKNVNDINNNNNTLGPFN